LLLLCLSQRAGWRLEEGDHVAVTGRTEREVDYYEVLQISPNAESETIQRVYRLLAQRYHPDNQESGNADHFRLVHEAYTVLSDPDARVRYDVLHQQLRLDRWRLVTEGAQSLSDRGAERAIRVTVLELLCAQRRVHPNNPGLFPAEIEKLTGVPQEHLEFSTWYLIQKRLIQRSDSSRLVITAEGVDYLDESGCVSHVTRRLEAATESVA
jgi:curved DNA-binding protein CbpA